ncbi:MFS transporter [Cupriavidus oxalaticus]|uniref:MFS transporter n=1 Tax=Cupriavidus oxalaticus TaxID=96344 RepID=UPI00317D13CB
MARPYPDSERNPDRNLDRDIDVKRFIDARRFSPYQWGILAVCFLMIAIDAYDALTVGFVIPALMEAWHMEKSVFGPVMSASIVGMALGAMLSGPLYDRSTPKTVMVVSMVMFGLCSFASIFAETPLTLGIWRLLTGLGIGAAVPGANTLMFEYAPTRRSSLVINTIACGGMLGAAGCGVAAALLVPSFGWESLFVVGAVLPIALALVAHFAMPEPVRFMVLRDWPAERIAAVLRRIDPAQRFEGVRFVFTEAHAADQQSGMGVLLSRRLRTGTLMLWLAYFSGTFAYYLLMSWLPTLIQEAGASLRQATLSTSLLSVGGIAGAFCFGWLMDRFDRNTVISLAFAVGGASVWALGRLVGHPELLPVILFLTGVGLSGAMFSLPGLAAAFYPTNGRSAGIAWMYGIGRIGGILGPVTGGMLLHGSGGPAVFYAAVTATILIPALALWCKRRATLRLATASGAGEARAMADDRQAG